MSRLPIRLRVTLAFTAVMAIVLAGIGVFLHQQLRTELDNSIDQDLHARASELVGQIRVSDAGLGEAARTALAARGEEFAQVLTSSGMVFDAPAQRPEPPVLTSADLAGVQPGAPVAFERRGVPGLGTEPVRLVASGIRFEHQALVVVVGRSLADRDQALSSLQTLLLIGLPLALLLASLTAYAAAGGALRPVEAMRRRAAEISAAESSQRLPLPPARDELWRLGETLNAMLDRIQAALERERAFVDDASHELRTPLAMHRSELELALRYGGSEAELRASIVSAAEEADRLSLLAENLLVLARFDRGQALKTEVLDADDILETVRERLAGRAGEESRTLVVEPITAAAVRGDRVRLEQALSNLVENALRHGGGEIRLSTRENGASVEFHVTDEGTGFAPEFLADAFERFRLADPARGGAGAGLGLSIVKAIALAHGGDAGVANRPGGGADVWLRIPQG